MTIYSDQALDRWAEIYLANNLHRRGVSFGRFMGNPELLFDWLFGPFSSALPDEPDLELEEFCPLLPRQERAQREADFEDTLREIAAKREAEMDRDCGQTLCHKRRRTADARVCDGRFIQSMTPLAVVSARATGAHR